MKADQNFKPNYCRLQDRLTTLCSVLVSPDHPANHADFDKTPNTNFQTLGCARQDDAGVKLATFAALTPHVPFHVPKRYITDQLCEVAREIVSSNVAVPASDTN